MRLFERFGCEVIEQRPDRVVVRTAVTEEMLQTDGILSGGISAYLAETVGGFATKQSDGDVKQSVGTNLSATHLLPVFEGDVIETVATPIRIGGHVQHWHIEQFRVSDGALFNVSQLTSYTRS